MKTITILLLSTFWVSAFADDSGEPEWKSTLPMTEYSNEYDYLYLNAFPDPKTDGGYCVFLQDEHGDAINLITTKGAVSKGQIRKAVRYASYPEQATIGFPVAIIGGLAGTSITGLNPVAISIAAVGAQVGFMSYFLHKGVKEEESSKATLISVVSFFPESIFVEEKIRASRADHLVKDDKLLTFSSEERGWRWVKYLGFKKLDLIAARLQEITPKYPQGCHGEVQLFKTID